MRGLCKRSGSRGDLLGAVAAWTVLASYACGGATPAPAVAKRAPVTAPAAPAPAPTRDPHASVGVRGLTGTLNKDDVHQTMEARQEAFDACIDGVRRRDRWVEGAIRFEFWVDAEGKVEKAVPVENDLGHHELEQCLTTVVVETVFPKPAGRATARFSWDLRVEPAYTPAEWIDPKPMKKVVQKKAKDAFRECKVRRFRNRLLITAYVGRAGRILSLGAMPNRPQDPEKLACLLEEVKHWRLPKQKRRSKVSFVLH